MTDPKFMTPPHRRAYLWQIPPSSRDGNRKILGWPEKSNAGIVGML